MSFVGLVLFQATHHDAGQRGWNRCTICGYGFGCVRNIFVVAGLLLATRPSPPGFLPGALVGVVQAAVATLAAVWGGWKLGWLYAAAAYAVVLFLASRINTLGIGI